jgi:hypothetical protein
MPALRSDLALGGLAVVGVLADLACVLTGHPAPPLFESIALGGLTAAAGVALPNRAADPAPAPDPVPAAAGYAPYLPAPQPQAVQVPQPYTGPVGQ